MKFLDFPGYSIVRPISERGSKNVFIARNRNGKLVAIKVERIDIGTDDAQLKRFERGIGLARSLEHENLVTVLDGGVTSDHIYVVSEYVEGVDFETFYGLKKAVRLSDAMALMRRAIRGLMYMHERQIIHRNIKPSNFLITGANEVRVTGFGIAKSLDANVNRLTVVGQIIAAPFYMSPEQCVCANNIDHRTDIYSIGCVLYFSVCRRPPFSHKNYFDVMMAHVKEPPPPIGLLVENCPKILVDLIERTMAKKPENRPDSLSDIHQTLRLPELVAEAREVFV